MARVAFLWARPFSDAMNGILRALSDGRVAVLAMHFKERNIDGDADSAQRLAGADQFMFVTLSILFYR